MLLLLLLEIILAVTIAFSAGIEIRRIIDTVQILLVNMIHDHYQVFFIDILRVIFNEPDYRRIAHNRGVIESIIRIFHFSTISVSLYLNFILSVLRLPSYFVSICNVVYSFTVFKAVIKFSTHFAFSSYFPEVMVRINTVSDGIECLKIVRKFSCNC